MDRSPYLEITPALRVPRAELTYRATRAGGPGGQHVNTSSTRVELWWDVVASPSLTDEQRARLLVRLAARLDARGRLRIVSAGSRSQAQNREEATVRFEALVAAALHIPKTRRRTKVPRAAKQRRLDSKRKRSARKRDRRRTDGDD